MTDLIYPTLDLFVYDLRNGLGDNQLEISDRRNRFLEKLPDRLHDSVREGDRNCESEYQKLWQPKSNQDCDDEFTAKRDADSLKGFDYPVELKGYYYPVRVEDNYGLLVDCSVENKTDPQSANLVKELRQEIEQNQLKGKQGNIGQSWMISGWIPPSPKKTPEQIARAYYQALMPDGDWAEDLDGKGKCMGADIFELSQYDVVMKSEILGRTRRQQAVDATIQDIQKSTHIIIIIYPDRETADQAAYFYSDWMRLLAYRHKILWCYGQSRLLKQLINLHFSEVEEYQKQIQQELSTGQQLEISVNLLRQVQMVLNNYTIDLNSLDLQGSTIEINLSNYQKRLARIENRAQEKTEILSPESNNAQNDLSFLQDFSQLVTDKYLLQIQKDSKNLERGQKLLVNIINAAKSRVEVEKTDRDRQFQDLVTIVGVGWAAGSFVKDYTPKTPSETNTSTSQSETKRQTDGSNTNSFYSNYISPLVYPVLVAIVVALLTGWLKNSCDRSPLLARIFGFLVGKISNK